MKTYTAQLPIVVSNDGESSRFFDHYLTFKLPARSKSDAVKRLQTMLTTLTTNQKKRSK